jgi:hypothetical protein
MNAQELKAAIIDSFDNLASIDFIACEVPFNHYRRKADLVVSKDNVITAFEIKSRYDNLDALDSQLKDYERCFDEVVLVTSETHLKNLTKINRKYGLWVSDNEKILKKRNPKTIKRHKKESLLSLLTNKEIKESFKYIKNKNLDNLEIQKFIEKSEKMETIKNGVTNALKKRYRQRFLVFIEERGKSTHIDDLILISRENPKKLK